MKKEDLLSDEFLKQFKTGEDLNGFLAQLQKRGLEAILNGELDAHLGYGKHEKNHFFQLSQWLFREESKNLLWPIRNSGSKRQRSLIQPNDYP